MDAMMLQAVGRPRRGEYTPVLGTSMAGQDPEETDRQTREQLRQRAADRLDAVCALGRPGQSREELGLACAELLLKTQVRSQWAVEATPHLLEHPEDRERLVRLGSVGCPSFEDTLALDARLGPDREAFFALAEHAVPQEGLGMIQDPLAEAARALDALEDRNPEEAGRMGDLVGALGIEKALIFRPRLESDEIARFLREHKVCLDPEMALAHLTPDPNRESLETREQAAALVDRRGVLGLVGEPAMPFLMGLPDRNVLADAKLLVELRQVMREPDARALLADFKAGKLGQLEDLAQRFQVEKKLWGTDQKALASLRAGVPDYEFRTQALAAMKDRLGRVEYEDWTALRRPLPPEAGFTQGLEALARLREVLSWREAREVYEQMAHALTEGAWQGQSLDEGLERVQQNAAMGDKKAALDCLEWGPAGNSIGLISGGMAIGGTRIRSRNAGV